MVPKNHLQEAIDKNHKKAKSESEILGNNHLEKFINRNRIACGKSQLESGFQSKNEEE